MAPRRSQRATAAPSGWTLDGQLHVVNEGGVRDAFADHFIVTARERNARPISGLGVGAFEKEPHYHREAQLLYLVRGELTCEASGAWWIVPPNSALWVPSGVHHRIRARAPLEGYNVYLDPRAAKGLPVACSAVSVTPLFREVMFRLATQSQRASAHLVTVLLDELATVTVDKHRLPMPTNPRLQTLVTMLTANPADRADVKTWGKRVGLAERTLNRLLVHETGLSFTRWRQQLHVVLAIQHMARGATVQHVASELGYENASSFVTMFRRALGTSPAKYMATRT